MKTTVIAVLGTQKDAHGGDTPARWNTWRPTLGLVQHAEFHIDELHLVFSPKHADLAARVIADIKSVSPDTKVISDILELKDPWDFQEVYEKFYDYARQPCFHDEKKNYYIHISTGTHVEKICLFLLAESHLLRAKLVQTSPKEGHDVRHSNDSKGTINVIDLDLARYDKLAKRFEKDRKDVLSFLKQGIETRNEAFNKLIETIERVSVRTSDPILLMGPTGAGKSQLAKQIYTLKKLNGKLTGNFVAVNCATLGGDLAKSALFGHKKGAFSDARDDHDGFLKEANKGMLFLDEIGELPLDAQAMLLKAIEEKTFRPVGAASDEKSEFQLICGTNVDLTVPRADGATFRRDLLARINLWSFRLPGLADRREDIEPNLDYELQRFGEKTGNHISFSKEARARFLAFAQDPQNLWPGNFRDLNAMITRLGTLADGGRITAQDVDAEITRLRDTSPNEGNADLVTFFGPNYATQYDDFDLVQLARVIAVCRTSKSIADAARKLFAVSLKKKKSKNDTNRLARYLAGFGIDFAKITQRKQTQRNA